MATRERCPRCAELGKDRAGDNFGRWEDGHGHCFSCNYHEFSKVNQRAVLQSPVSSIAMPEDASTNIDAIALAWLSKYDIEMAEVVENRIMWSAGQKLLIFPVYADTQTSKLLGWQGKVFNEKAAYRYYNVGPFNEFFHILNLFEGTGDDLVVVEDLVSAIKVARRYSVMPLFGSHLSMNQMRRLKNFSERLTFWLDEDKMDKSMELAKQATQLGYEVKVVVTKHDPKVYNNAEIREILETH